MYNKKPEFIDPDEKNLTYFSHRTKEKKTIEKNDDCGSGCDKRFFFGIKTKNHRFPLLLIMYAGLIFAVFFFAHKKLTQKTDPSIQNQSGVQYILSAFPLKEKNHYMVQILLLNQEKTPIPIPLKDLEITAFNDKNQPFYQQYFPAQALTLDSSGLKNISQELVISQTPLRIKVVLHFTNTDIIELEKEF